MSEPKPIEAELVQPQQAVAIRPESGLSTISAMEQSFALAVRQRELLSEYIKKQLKPDQHFYEIKGQKKKSLTKEGAEVILLPHGLVPDYEWVSGPTEPPEGSHPYQITIKCVLRRSGDPNSFCGSGIGSASSQHSYWDRDAKAMRQKPRQPDPGLCHNATAKMAQKSAMIAATINSTAASEFFTQDMGPGEAPDEPQGGQPPSSKGEAPKASPTPKSAPNLAAYRAKLAKNIDKGGLREKASQFLIDLSWMLPTETIETMELRYVPRNEDEYIKLLAKITMYAATGKAEKPYEPHYEGKPIEVPRDEHTDPNSRTAPWRSYKVPFGKHKGTELAELDKNVLWGFWENFEPKAEYEDERGKVHQTKPEKLEEDRKFRAFLDEAGKHYEFKHADDDE